MLQIIPVIDIRGGLVVHARGGQRAHYQPLVSVLTEAVEPAAVIADLCRQLPLTDLYIADLDAIVQGKLQADFYRSLSCQFPQLTLWLDSGIRTAADKAVFTGMANLKLIAGSETLADTALLKASDAAPTLILSLDKKQGKGLGAKALWSQPALWPEQVILMNLDRVGAGAGPDLDWLRQMQQKQPACQWYLAGGIRNDVDLLRAQQAGATGVLLASALHNGSISTALLKELMQNA